MSSLEYRELLNRPEQSRSSATPTAGACRKCGYSGHLPFQCYNFLQPKGQSCADISSTSSESDYETPLTTKENKRNMKRKSKKHDHRKHHKRRKRSRSSSAKGKIKRKKKEKSL
ncbi:unnamed protein product [Onchocerca flexuosa]|uniref:CCHC-type domain-containing protein n=1 Tax=Onchocerca flexuosa TaxID=387005 RepID=A0A183HJC3_9BILA|nr:unnamed protein product [Onchocerca flexuosa]